MCIFRVKLLKMDKMIEGKDELVNLNVQTDAVYSRYPPHYPVCC